MIIPLLICATLMVVIIPTMGVAQDKKDEG